MFKRKRSQAEIFENFWWWDKGCFLYQMTGDRCDYIESCVTRGLAGGRWRSRRCLRWAVAAG